MDRISIKQILAAGLLLRLVAVFFSPGYSFHDDHFEVVELAWKWRDGISFTWDGGPVHLFSLIYPGIHYLLFSLCNAIGIHDPQDMMIAVRLFHALVSVFGIYYAYALTFRLSGQKSTANIVAIAMAVFWIFPFLSVRSLREFFCIPFLLAATYHAVANRPTIKQIAWAAFLFDIAFTIRFQIVFIPLGIGLYWVFKKGYLKTALLFGSGIIVFYFLTQGLFDWLYYGDPFASPVAYWKYNMDASNIKGYPQGPWYMYLGTLTIISLGLPVIPLLWGYIRSVKLSPQMAMVFFSSLLFFLFHSYYSNKQERFIFPFIPYFLILGIIGWKDYWQHTSAKSITILSKFFIGWLLLFNTAGLIILVFTYSKRARVESMVYLRKNADVSDLIMEGVTTPPPPPLFYLGRHLELYNVNTATHIDSIKRNASRIRANYIIMVGDKNLPSRLERLRSVFPNLHQEANIKPGFIDNIAYKLNPKHNQNETWYIYRIE